MRLRFSTAIIKQPTVCGRHGRNYFFRSTNCNGLKLKGKRAQVYSPYFSTHRLIWRAQCFCLRLNNIFLKRLSFKLISRLENTVGGTNLIKLIDRYARRVTIKNTIKNAIDYFHMEAPSATVAMKLDPICKQR